MSDPIVIEVSPPRGYSAYEIAVQQGFEGTIEEWNAAVNAARVAAEAAADIALAAATPVVVSVVGVSHNLVADDRNKVITFDNDQPCRIYVPDGLPAGFEFSVRNKQRGVITIVCDTDSVQDERFWVLRPQSEVKIYKADADSWVNTSVYLGLPSDEIAMFGQRFDPEDFNGNMDLYPSLNYNLSTGGSRVGSAFGQFADEGNFAVGYITRTSMRGVYVAAKQTQSINLVVQDGYDFFLVDTFTTALLRIAAHPNMKLVTCSTTNLLSVVPYENRQVSFPRGIFELTDIVLTGAETALVDITSRCQSVWSPDGDYLFVLGATADLVNEREQFIHKWSFDGNSFTYEGADSIGLMLAGNIGIYADYKCWSPDGQFLVVGGSIPSASSDVVIILSWDGTTLSRHSSQVTLPNSVAGVANSSTNTKPWFEDKFIVSCNVAPFMYVVQRNTDDTFTVLADSVIDVPATAFAFDLDWSQSGKYVMMGTTFTPRYHWYEWDRSTMTRKYLSELERPQKDALAVTFTDRGGNL